MTTICKKEVPAFTDCATDTTAVDSNPCFGDMCVEIRDGLLCPADDFRSPWQFTENTADNCLIDSYINEQLAIAGADVNLYKLLGVHEQGKLIDLTGDGTSISGGDHPNFPSKNAFDLFNTEWRSVQVGQNVLTKSFIGYDFGEIRLDNDRLRYGIETFIKHNISRIKFKQGCATKNKVTMIRLERSHDGDHWFGVGVATVDDCDGIVTIDFPASVPSRFWRIRPLSFNGDNTDYWSVQALQLIEYEHTSVDNIQDKVFMENRDRDYAEFPITLKGSYAPVDSQSFFAKFGQSSLLGGETYFIELNWSAVVGQLGRPIVIGDIIQLPSETQYSASLTPVLKYLTVSDVGWSVNGYTPTWTPTMVRIQAQPAIASSETQQIFGNLVEEYDDMGLASTGDGANNKKYQDISDIDQNVRAEANTEVPELGEDTANVTEFSTEMYEWGDAHNVNISKHDRHRNLWAQDGMPPNGESYTQADEFPPSPKQGDYHRLTYTKIRQGIAPRLYRYSEDKGTWIYLETDKRAYNSVIRKQIQEFTDPEWSTVTRPDEIDEEFSK